MRQALAGMLWSKQYFFLDADKWLEEHGVDPLRPSTRQVRNREWFHMISDHIISMPDKWEYPWFAAWDLAFPHACLVERRHRFRQAAARSAAEPGLPAS